MHRKSLRYVLLTLAAGSMVWAIWSVTNLTARNIEAVTCITPPPGLVSWWPGDGNADDIQSGNNGALQGGATFATGAVGQGFRLDGTDDFVLVPDSSNLNILGDVTIDLWARRTTFGGGHMVMKGAGTIGTTDVPTAYALLFETDDSLLGIFELADGTDVFFSGPVVTDTNLHHYAYVRGGNTHKLLMDGAVVASNTFAQGPANASGTPLTIGAARSDAQPTGYARFFGGTIDEVEVFS